MSSDVDLHLFTTLLTLVGFLLIVSLEANLLPSVNYAVNYTL